MGVVDIRRQAPNVSRMKILGSEVIGVSSGAGTLKDAVSEAMRDWARTVEETHYVIGSVVGPHPFPWIVRELQKVIGEEILQQSEQLPDVAVACVGGGSNAIGMFWPLAGTGVELVGVEAGGDGIGTGRHGASIGAGSPGILHGAWTYMLQDDDGQVLEAHSISAGSRLSGSGTGALLLSGGGLGSVCLDHRPGGARRGEAFGADRGNHPRLGERSCGGLGSQGGGSASSQDSADQPVG